jgi:hypothetical protein
MRSLRVLVGLSLVCVVAVRLDSAAAATGFELTNRIGGPPISNVSLTIEADQTSVSRQLFVTWTGQTALTNVQLTAVMSGATATVSQAAQLTLTPNEPMPFSVTVAEVSTTAKTLHGSIVISGTPAAASADPSTSSPATPAIGGVLGTLTVTVTTATQPSDITFVGVVDGSTTATTRTAGASVPLRLKNDGASTVDVGLTPSAVSGPADSSAKASVSSSTLTVPAGQVADFTVELSDLTTVGDYTTFVNVNLGERSGPQLRVLVQRVLGDLKLTVTVGPPSSRIDTGDTATATFEVKNDGASPVDLQLELGSVNRLEGTANDSDDDVELASNPCDGGKCAIGPGQTMTLRAPLQGFDDAGTYTVPINMVAEGLAGQATTTFTVSARSGLLTAVIFFGIGVVVLGGLLLGLRAWRRRTDDEVLLARTLEPLSSLRWSSPAPEHERRLHEALSHQVAAVRSKLGDTTFAAAVGVLTNQIAVAGPWLRTEQVRLEHGLVVPTALVDILAAFDVAEMDAAARDRYLSTIAGLYTQGMVEGREQDLRRAIIEFTAELTNEDVDAIVAELDEAHTKVIDPATAAAADRAVNDADVAWRAQMASRVNTYAAKPWYAADDWDRIAAPGRALAARVATDTTTGASKLVQEVLAELRRLLAESAMQLGRKADQLAAEEQDAEAKRRLENAATAARRLPSASGTLSARRNELTQLVDQLPGGQREMHRQSPAPEMLRRESGDLGWIVGDGPTVAGAKRLKTFVSVGGFALAAVVAVLTAIAFVYMPNATWGSSADRFAAVLWGIGFSSATQLSGLAAIRQNLFEG